MPTRGGKVAMGPGGARIGRRTARALGKYTAGAAGRKLGRAVTFRPRFKKVKKGR